MKFLCICPTYGRPPNLLADALACFLAQTHVDAYLMIYDDLGNHKPEVNDRWAMVTSRERSPNLIRKYNIMLGLAESMKLGGTGKFDALANWEDDDLYLPTHLEQHAKILENCEFSYPSEVWTTYSTEPAIIPSAGTYWASVAIRFSSFLDGGGFIATPRADFDQLNMRRWESMLKVGDPSRADGPTYVFRWADTGVPHGQSTMRSPDDTTWYARFKPAYTAPVPMLQPALSSNAVRTLEQIRAQLADRVNPLKPA
jgi:hypothetical protein